MSDAVGFELVDFGEELAMTRGELGAVARAHGLSPGGRARLALARRRGLPAFTADAAWTRLPDFRVRRGRGAKARRAVPAAEALIPPPGSRPPASWSRNRAATARGP